ncbi:hypothetical protein ElyMa_003662800 [Elysia marginata]|uniref:NADP-dependent oxidoreductase domain-containing protein n=1 Tax=Elysia marginata TaxID=1093978 RepID=A0AAV4EZJ7_9GAST|nr:hypothetical protein ElyMa_003662800 [Elysia marginata]
MWWYRRLLRISWKERKTNEEVLQAADVTEIALRWSCCKGELGTSFAASLGSEGLRAQEVEDALKGAGRTTPSNGPTIVHTWNQTES